MSREHCRQPDACKAKTPGKHCAPCSLSAIRRDPAIEAKRAASFRDRLARDPEFRAKHAQASAARLAKWRAQPGVMVGANERSRANLALANTPEALERRTAAIRRHRVGWCPPDRLEDYYALRRQVGAAEARRMMEDELARLPEIRSARRAIAEFDRQQRERHAREQREAY